MLCWAKRCLIFKLNVNFIKQLVIHLNEVYDLLHIKSKKTKFKSIIIGKNVIKGAIIILILSLVCVSFVAILKNVNKDIADYFYKSCYKSAVLSVSAYDDAFNIKKPQKSDIKNTAFKFILKQTPIFYAFNDAEPKTEEVFNFKYEDNQPLKTDEKKLTIPKVNVKEHTNSSANIDIKNETSYSIYKDEFLKNDGNIRLESNKKPQILIVHTHGSESYTQSEKYKYSPSDYARCQDTRFNVVRVGEELYKELTKKGFNVIHDKSINDYPSYNQSYNKTLAKIEKHLKENPTIKCVFDVHRDAIMFDDETKLKLTKTVNGEKVSQIMIVCGSDDSGLENPKWRENLGFALEIQKQMEKLYPGLMRPVNLRKERFNMHKTTGSLIFEFGTHGNTMDEALASVKYLAEGISKVLK